jgi:formate-dependent nitrite reductase cytochrome c552 subunit
MRNNRLAMTMLCVLAVVFMVSACERTVTTVEETHTASACFDCHSDQHTELVAAEGQWSYSVHASGANIDRNATSRGTMCQVCHTSEGFVAKATGATVPAVVDNPTAIHCFTCHAPHTNSNLALRVNDPQSLATGDSFDMSAGNICASCHVSRQNVETYVEEPTDLSEHWGPHHSPQSDLLWGKNGYEYSWYSYGQTTHKDATADGCLDCHFRSTSNYVVGGHSFNMTFISEGDTLRNTYCGNCHGSMDDFNYHFKQDTVHTLMEDLLDDLVTAGLMNAEGHPLDDVTTSMDSAGAVWNFLFVEEDRSVGIHNAQYAIDLLRSAIQFITTGPPPAPPAPPVAGKVEEEDTISRK